MTDTQTVNEAELMTFKEGQELPLLPERRCNWQPEKITVVSVFDHGRFMAGVSHRYSVKATNGHFYSGWWFDPKAPTVSSDEDDID